MGIGAAEICESAIVLRVRRRTKPVVMLAGVALASAAFLPLAVAAFGIARGGIEPYIVLAALMLG